ncbi:MAG: hypothetical protein IT213_00710 [Cytophagales bacterium]|jgi:hypothetical protein|nr:hypothetical protein [Cytophagales bacterium]
MMKILGYWEYSFKRRWLPKGFSFINTVFAAAGPSNLLTLKKIRFLIKGQVEIPDRTEDGCGFRSVSLSHVAERN